jgi:hypothetical protein
MVRANQFVTEAVDSDAMNELKLFIANDEDLYRRQFMPIVANIKRKIKRGVYNHELAPKLWMYLVDNAAKKYVNEFGSQDQDVKDMFPKETRLQVAQIIADREKENIEKGEYDVVKGTVSPRG